MKAIYSITLTYIPTCMFPNMSILGNKQDFKLQVTRSRLVNITSQSHILYSDTVITALILYDSAILNQNWGSGLVSGSRSCRYHLWEVKNYAKIEMVNFIGIPYAFRDGPMDLIFYMQMTKNTITFYAPMIYTAPCVMLLTRAASITRASGRGLGPGNQCCGSGSGIRCFLDPWIRDSGPGIRDG